MSTSWLGKKARRRSGTEEDKKADGRRAGGVSPPVTSLANAREAISAQGKVTSGEIH